jgi:hypothetical protein
MVGITAAIIGSAVLGAGAQIISGNKAAKAQRKAADQQVAEARRQYDQDREDLAPWRTTGGAAIMKMGDLYGLNGTAADTSGGPGSYGGFFESPDYQFRLDEGKKAIERSASARGMLGSGAALKASNDYAQNVASGEYGNWYNRLAGIAGVGQAATNTGIAAGQASTNNIINAYGAAGNARASAYANTGSAINSGINNVLSAYLFNKGGGFGSWGPGG